MTPARPNPNPKVTRSTEENRQASLDQGLRVQMGEESYEVRIGDISSSVARELRVLTGRGPYRLIETVAKDPDLDVLAEFVWLARRIRGEEVDLSEIELSYADMLDESFDVTLPGGESVDQESDAPEA